MKFNRKINPSIKSNQNFITKKRLKEDEINFNKLRSIWKEIPKASSVEEEQIEIEAHYSGYLEKQEADIIAFRRDENIIIPNDIDYVRKC